MALLLTYIEDVTMVLSTLLNKNVVHQVTNN